MEILKASGEYEDLKQLDVVPTGITYGPVKSRRLGTSLGINLIGSTNKICSYNCPYCELGLTQLTMAEMKKADGHPSLEAIDTQVRQRLLILSKEKIVLDHITLSGYGEPTLYPDFDKIVPQLKKIRDELYPETPLVALSNGGHLDVSKIVKAMNLLDERIIKVDAGNDEMLKKIGSPLIRISIAKLIQGSKRLKDVIVQTMFVHGAIDNTVPNEIEDWIEVLGIIKPKAVQIYTLDRVPPLTGLKQVPFQRLKEISMALQKRTTIKGIVFS
jgi:wyosine [tRNA(Phe)-imidazoG37] synthetase (radical SAM superfamily)